MRTANGDSPGSWGPGMNTERGVGERRPLIMSPTEASHLGSALIDRGEKERRSSAQVYSCPVVA